MLEETVASVPSIWGIVSSWFTPTVLFVVLNLVIGTIALTSTLKNSNNEQQQHNCSQPQYISRSPSMLQRLKSFNVYPYRYQEHTAMETPHEIYSLQYSQPQAYYHEELEEKPSATRSPSMMQRLKSINLYSYVSPEKYAQKTHVGEPHLGFQKMLEEEGKAAENPQETETHSGFLNVQEEKREETDTQFKFQKPHKEKQEEKVSSGPSRTKSDTVPASGELPQRLARKMRKSASTKSAFSHFKEDDIADTRRPEAVQEGTVENVEADEEVDAKADDFINKFKQQLKLQRIDSIMRYKEMVSRGTAK